jgi:nitroreductase
VEVFEAIEKRRAVKHYDPGHVISDEDCGRLLDALRLAPTAWNIQNTRIVVVKDPAQRQKLREVAFDQAQVTDASLLFVFCADTKSWENNPGRYWQTAPEPMREQLAQMIRQYYDGREWVQRDEALRSCGMAAQTLMLAAKSLGYDSCPMDGFDYDKVGEIVGLPENHLVAMFVAVGKGTKEAHPRGGFIPQQDAVKIDRF